MNVWGRRSSDTWRVRVITICLCVNCALFALNLTASIIFLVAARNQEANNRRIGAILEQAEQRQRQQQQQWRQWMRWGAVETR